MGKCYSINGFLNAVLRRSAPTLLVEGPTDGSAVHRVLAQRTSEKRRPLNVDNSTIVRDDALSGLGAKQRVLLLCSMADAHGTAHPKLSSWLACLTDREWDGLILDPETLPAAWRPPHQTQNRFVTMGHSIENYHFSAECFSRYLRYAFPDLFTAELERRINSTWGAALALAGALSFEARAAECLTRLNGLLEPNHIQFGDDGIFLAPAFDEPASRRGLDVPNLFRIKVNDLARGNWRILAAAPHAQWIIHGHIGSEVIWSWLGGLASSAGAGSEIVKQIAYGNRNDRMKWWQDWVANGPSEGRIPLDHIGDWLQAAVSVDRGDSDAES